MSFTFRKISTVTLKVTFSVGLVFIFDYIWKSKEIFAMMSNPNTKLFFNDDDVSICAVVKSYYLNDTIEWIDYHSNMVGLKKMFIFDHNSIVPLKDALQEYIRSGFVHYETINHVGSDYAQSA
jgi:hypothetical protein